MFAVDEISLDWPATAVTVGAAGLIFVALLAFVFQRHHKSRDASRTVQRKLEVFKDRIVFASRRPNGEKLDQNGEFEVLFARLVELKAAIEILNIHDGSDQVAATGQRLFESARELYVEVHKAVLQVTGSAKNPSPEMNESGRRELAAAQQYLSDPDKTSRTDEQLKALVDLVNRKPEYSKLAHEKTP